MASSLALLAMTETFVAVVCLAKSISIPSGAKSVAVGVIIWFVGATVGGAIGWWLGAFVGMMTAYMASTVGTALGVYLARRFEREYLS